MTVVELLKILQSVDADLLVGLEDQGGEVCEVHFAGATYDCFSRPHFFIRAAGGFPLFGDDVIKDDEEK
jgi:hypothetical protein